MTLCQSAEYLHSLYTLILPQKNMSLSERLNAMTKRYQHR